MIFENEQSLYSFLENEEKRLDKIIQMFIDKIPILIEANQTKTLIAEQIKNNEQLEEAIMARINQPESDFQQNISVIFDQSLK